MKICICISGQVRGEMVALKKLADEIKKVPEMISVTIIFSIWKRTGLKIDGYLGFSQLHRIFEPDLAKIIPISYYGINFWNNFPKTYKFLKNQCNIDFENEIKNLFPKAIIDIEDEILDLEFSVPKIDKNSIKMLYKRWRCNEIKKKIERESGKFDLVMVTRPDYMFTINPNINPNVNLESETTIYIPNPSDRFKYVNDLMAYGSSIVIDKYCSLFSKSISTNLWKNIHFELFKHLQSLNIQIAQPDLFKGAGLEKQTLIDSDIVTKDNKFIKSLYDSSYDIHNANKIELISIYTKLYLEWKDIDNLQALKYLILADFSNRKIINFYDRDHYVFNELLHLFDSLDIYSINEFMKLDFEFSINEQCKENLELFSSSPKYLNFVKAKDISVAIDNKNLDELLSIDSMIDMPNYLADKFRDFAIELESNDLNSAFHLMKLAKDIRPGGPFIASKYNEYKKKLGM